MVNCSTRKNEYCVLPASNPLVAGGGGLGAGRVEHCVPQRHEAEKGADVRGTQLLAQLPLFVDAACNDSLPAPEFPFPLPLHPAPCLVRLADCFLNEEPEL